MDSPTGYSITPWLSVRNSVQAVEFYRKAFHANEVFHLDGDDGSVVSRLSVEGAEFWVSEESPGYENHSPQSLGGSTVRMILTVPEPYSFFERAIHGGAIEIFPVGEEHGWCLGRLKDPFGHHWEIGRPL